MLMMGRSAASAPQDVSRRSTEMMCVCITFGPPMTRPVSLVALRAGYGSSDLSIASKVCLQPASCQSVVDKIGGFTVVVGAAQPLPCTTRCHGSGNTCGATRVWDGEGVLSAGSAAQSDAWRELNPVSCVGLMGVLGVATFAWLSRLPRIGRCGCVGPQRPADPDRGWRRGKTRSDRSGAAENGRLRDTARAECGKNRGCVALCDIDTRITRIR